ncbi:hypothetical protein ACP70R_019180 [Stipagrostis hirtigluma subsp. patula]
MMVQPELPCPWSPSELSLLPAEQELSDLISDQHFSIAISTSPRLKLDDTFYPVIWNDAIADEQTHSDHGADDYLEPSMLASLVPGQGKGRWGGHRRRKSRKRSTTWTWKKDFETRKNNEQWTYEEVSNLVEGISKYGVGNWTKVKRDYFETSVREAPHLKDKWTNLLRACGLQVGSKKKGESTKGYAAAVERVEVYNQKHSKELQCSEKEVNKMRASIIRNFKPTISVLVLGRRDEIVLETWCAVGASYDPCAMRIGVKRLKMLI